MNITRGCSHRLGIEDINQRNKKTAKSNFKRVVKI